MLKSALIIALFTIASGTQFPQRASRYSFNQPSYYGSESNVFRALEGFGEKQGDYYGEYHQGYPYNYREVFGDRAQVYPFYNYQRQPFGFFHRVGDEVEESFQQRYGFYPVRDGNQQFVGYYTRYPYSADYEFPVESVPSELRGYGFEPVADDQGRVRSFVFRNPENFYNKFGSQYGYQPARFYGSNQFYYPQSYNRGFGSEYGYQPAGFYGSQKFYGYQPEYAYGQQYSYPNQYFSYNREFQPQYFYNYPNQYYSYNRNPFFYNNY